MPCVRFVGATRQVTLCVVLIFSCGVLSHARRQRYSRKELSNDASKEDRPALVPKQRNLENYWPSLPEGLTSQSLMERAHNNARIDSGEPLTISAIVGIVFAIISVVTTIWDLWEKWNAIIMLKYALSEMKNSDWSTLQKYKKYSEISFCVRDRINEAVDTMNVVATYFKMLHYAETQCSRPDVHLDWLTTSKRCTRDFATERIEEIHTEICSAQYGEGLFSTVEMLQDDSSVKPSMSGCECLEDHLCDGKNWCRVAEDSTCPDKGWSIGSGHYSYIPCEVKGMVDEDKARSLLKSICTVCNHGFFRNAGLIESNLYSGNLDPNLKGKDIKDERIRQAVKMRHSNCTSSAGRTTPDMNVIEDDTHITVEEKVYLEVMKWERLIEFDKKCNDFKATLGTNERTQMTGEDLVNEKINRLTVDGRLGKLGSDMEWQAKKVGNLFAKKGADAFDKAQGKVISLLELEDLQEVRRSVYRLQARREPEAAGPNFDKCSDYKILNQDTDDLKAMTVDSSDIMAASECAAIEGATSRDSAWRRLGVACKCEAFSTKVYCGQDVIAERKFKLEDVTENKCQTKMYCSKFPKTEKQVNVLVKSRLGCSTIAGAADQAMNSAPMCKCTNPSHMLFCGDVNYGRGSKFHLHDDVLNNRQCFENARCAEPVDKSSLEIVNAEYEANEACIQVFGAKPRESILAGKLQSADCKCDYNQEVYCGQERISSREFQRREVLQAGCFSLLYCAEKAWPDDEVLAMMRTSAKPVAGNIGAGDLQLGEEKVTVEQASLIQLRSSNEGAADILLWVPMQLARVLKVTTQGIVDWGQAIWWFAFNNVYGAMGTVEAFGLLAKATQLWDKFVQWTGIVTFFIWLINDAIFVGMNSAMCPKIADWIEIMDGVRASSGAEGNKGNNTAIASDQYVYGSKGVRVSESSAVTRQWCDTKLEDVNAETQRELIERTVILRQMVEFEKESASKIPVKLNDPTEVLDFLETDPDELQKQVEKLSWTDGDEKVGLKLSRTHAKVTSLLKERLSIDAICPVSDKVMKFRWKDSPKLKMIHERKIQDNACQCDPRPQGCGAIDDGPMIQNALTIATLSSASSTAAVTTTTTTISTTSTTAESLTKKTTIFTETSTITTTTTTTTTTIATTTTTVTSTSTTSTTSTTTMTTSTTTTIASTTWTKFVPAAVVTSTTSRARSSITSTTTTITTTSTTTATTSTTTVATTATTAVSATTISTAMVSTTATTRTTIASRTTSATTTIVVAAATTSTATATTLTTATGISESIKLTYTFKGLSYDKVKNRPNSWKLLITSIKQGILASLPTEYTIGDIDVSLSPGSVIADIQVKSKPGSSASMLIDQIKESPNMDAVVLGNVKGISGAYQLLESGKTMTDIIAVRTSDPEKMSTEMSEPLGSSCQKSQIRGIEFLLLMAFSYMV